MALCVLGIALCVLAMAHGVSSCVALLPFRLPWRGWGSSAVVEHLPSKRKALGSVLSSGKKKDKITDRLALSAILLPFLLTSYHLVLTGFLLSSL